jgi:hypothetical protein
MPTNASTSGRNTRQLMLRRRRSVSLVVLGASLMLGSEFLRLIPGLGSVATASTLLNGRAFIDINADGVQSANLDPLYNEVGIPNVTVTVTSSSGASVVAITNQIGDWLVDTDLVGPFRIQYTGLPAKLSDGSNRAGSLQFNNGGLTSFGAFGKVDNLGTVVDLTNTAFVGIGNRVWDDFNANGLQDAGEPGIPNVVITIASPGGPLRTIGGCNGTNGDGVATTVTTDAQGLYQFVCLETGKSFTLSIDKSQLGVGGPLEGYNATLGGAGGDITLDSNGQDGGSAIIGSGITKAGFDMTYDFGFTKPGGNTTTTTASATTTTIDWETTTTAPTTTICETTTTTTISETTTAPATTTTVVWDTTTTAPATTTTVVWDTTTTTVPDTTTTTGPVTTTTKKKYGSTTTTVPVTTTTTAATTTVPATTTTVPVTTTIKKKYGSTTTTVPVTTTTVSATTTTVPVTTTTKKKYGSTTTTVPVTTTTVPATTTTTVPVTTTTTSTTTTSTTTTSTTTTSTTTTTTSTTIFSFVFVPATTTTVPVATPVIAPAPTSPSTSTTTVATSTTSAPTIKPVNVLGDEIVPLPAPGDVPAFTGSAATYRGFQGFGLLMMGFGLAGLVRGRKERYDC